MGQADNTPNISGDEKMEKLNNHKLLSEQYQGKKWNDLRAADQFEIDLQFDQLKKSYDDAPKTVIGKSDAPEGLQGLNPTTVILDEGVPEGEEGL